MTLSEELEWVRRLNENGDQPVGIYPEIKRPAWHREQGVDVTPGFLETLDNFGYREHQDPVYVQCFDAAELRRIRHDGHFHQAVNGFVGRLQDDDFVEAVREDRLRGKFEA